jgi:uncharacterized membrane protein YkoI
MRVTVPSIVVSFAAVLAVACSGPTERELALRAALDQSHVPLRDSVGIARASVEDSIGVKAVLLVDAAPVYSVRALASRELRDVRVDIASGAILSTASLGQSPDPCPGAIDLAEAITIAEAEMNGEAVSIGPDDDDACDREVQVMAGETLWEVKLAADGRVIETEESDDD